MSGSLGTLLFYSQFDDPAEWREHLHRAAPDLSVRVFPDVGEPREVDYALVWKPPSGFFRRLTNLKLVINLGAGVDALVGRDDLAGLPVMRLSDPDMITQMTTYVVAAVLRYTRDFDIFEADTERRRWTYVHPRRQGDVSVGVLGLGELGLPAAQALLALGLDVRGWARSSKSLSFPTASGLQSLSAFVAPLDVVVSMLPNTASTRGLLDGEFFAAMKPGAAFVNASRGEVVDEAALVAALDGHLRGATLDAFQSEPLAVDHPLRDRANVLVTPHIASVAGPAGSAPEIAENIRRLRRGEGLAHLADLSRGY